MPCSLPSFRFAREPSTRDKPRLNNDEQGSPSAPFAHRRHRSLPRHRPTGGEPGVMDAANVRRSSRRHATPLASRLREQSRLPMSISSRATPLGPTTILLLCCRALSLAVPYRYNERTCQSANLVYTYTITHKYTDSNCVGASSRAVRTQA